MSKSQPEQLQKREGNNINQRKRQPNFSFVFVLYIYITFFFFSGHLWLLHPADAKSRDPAALEQLDPQIAGRGQCNSDDRGVLRPEDSAEVADRGIFRAEGAGGSIGGGAARRTAPASASERGPSEDFR